MKLYWDLGNDHLVKSFANAQDLDEIAWVLRDQVPVELRLGEESDATNEYVQQEAPAGWSIVFSLKKPGSLSGTDLVLVTSWALVGTGTSAYYTATIDLAAAALIADMGETDTDYVGEFLLDDGAGNHIHSTQFTAALKADVYRGTEGTP